MLLNNQWIVEKNKEERKYLETNENRSTMIQNLWDAAGAVLTEFHSNSLTSGERMISTTQPYA